MTDVEPLRCQVEAARFATRRDRVDEIRTNTIRAAVAHLVAGHRNTALDEMLDGLALQAPLTFHRPQNSRSPGMSDEPTEQDVEALTDSIAVCFSNVSHLPEWMQIPALGRDMRPLTVIAARAVLRSDWYAERIAQARREGAAEHRLEWADYIERWSGAIGPEPPTVESIVAALRRNNPPFGGPNAALGGDDA